MRDQSGRGFTGLLPVRMGGHAIVEPIFAVGRQDCAPNGGFTGGHAAMGVGAGLRFDFNEHYHVLAYAGPGVQNAAEMEQLS